MRAIRRRPGSDPTSAPKGLEGGPAQYGSPGAGPAATSSMAALSRTLRLTTWSVWNPHHASPSSGASDSRARVGFSPTTPQHAAGERIDPPPSLAWAAGIMRAATAAAAPPLDPPAMREMSQGFRVGPWSKGSVLGFSPNSGALVRPTITRPAAR